MVPLVRISDKEEDSRNTGKGNEEQKTGEEERGEERKGIDSTEAVVQPVGTWLSVYFNSRMPFITLKTPTDFLQTKISNYRKNAEGKHCDFTQLLWIKYFYVVVQRSFQGSVSLT